MVMKVFRSRKFARRVLVLLLILIIPAFVLWGAGSVTRGSQLIGIIGKEKIYPDDLVKSLQGIKTQLLFVYYGNFAALRQILQNRQLMNVMAWERLVMLEGARRGKMNIGNEAVLAFISQHPLFQRDGAFDPQVYKYVLQNNLGITPREFEELVRENMKIQFFRQGLLKDVDVTDEELLEVYNMANDKVRVSYILIEKDDFADEVTVLSEEARAYYEENAQQFIEPEKAEVEYISFAYDSPEEKSEVLRKIEKVYPLLREDPAGFKGIAENNGLRYASTGTFTANDVIPGMPFFKGFQDMSLSLQENEISPPIFSAEGKGNAYIIHRTGVTPPRELAFDEVSQPLTGALKESKLLSLAGKRAGEIHAAMLESGETFESAARSLGTDIKATDLQTVSGYFEGIGPSGEIIARAREAGEGNITGPIIVKKGAIIARVDQIVPADRKAFDDEKETIRAKVLQAKQMQALDDWFRAKAPRVELRKDLKSL